MPLLHVFGVWMIEVALLVVPLLGGHGARGDLGFSSFFRKHMQTVWGGVEVVRVLAVWLPRTFSIILRMVNLGEDTNALSHLLEVDRHFFQVVRGADPVDDVNLIIRI